MSKKPKRVVLGIGLAYFGYAGKCSSCEDSQPTMVEVLGVKGCAKFLLRTQDLEGKRIRLVAEVLDE